MTVEPDYQLPPPVDPWPTLAPEYRLAIATASGCAIYTGVLTEQEAQEIAGRLKVARWRLERRMVTEWTAAGPNMRSRVVVDEVGSIPELDAHLNAPSAEPVDERESTP